MSDTQTRGYETQTKCYTRHTGSVTWRLLRERDHHRQCFGEDDCPDGETWNAVFRRITEEDEEFDDFVEFIRESPYPDSNCFTLELVHLNEGEYYGVQRNCH